MDTSWVEDASDGAAVVIVGPGAVGGLIAVALERSGADVAVVARPTTAELINAEGLTVRSPALGDGTSKVRSTTAIAPSSAVILSIKATGLDDVIPQLQAASPKVVLTLLNGLDHVGRLREALPGTEIVGASISVEALRLSPTVIDHRSPFARIVIPESAASLEVVTALRATGLSVTDGGSEKAVLWGKLRFLAPFALLTSYSRGSIGPAMDTDPQLTAALIAEVAEVASAEGVSTTAEELTAALRSFPATGKSSLQHDLAAGNPSEIDAIGGAVLRAAASHGVETPALERVVEALR